MMIALPEGPSEILHQVIEPAMLLLPDRMNTHQARLLILAIMGQESAWKYRRQIGGPAKGLAQFERAGGVRGVLRHPASKDMAHDVCRLRGIAANETAAFNALELDDILAACFARLLLWTDPKSLPDIGEEDKSWDYYLRNWRPGKPHPKAWPANYQKAMTIVTSSVE